jgi:formate hydrogenlyase transcriptional activator
MNSQNEIEHLAVSRYRTLAGVSEAVASEPDVHGVLHSIAALLSKTVPFDSMVLLLVNRDKETAQIYALESDAIYPGIDVGTEVPFKNTAVDRAIETQEPVFLPDARQEMLKLPQFARYAHIEKIQSSYIFPISTARKKLGVLIFAASGREQYTPGDVELMGLVAAHISVALENALALESADIYRRELEGERLKLERERDRFKLLLEINNHIVNHLDVHELFSAASGSIREYFDNAFTGFWLFDEATNELHCYSMDFPGSRSSFDTIPASKPSENNIKTLRTRTPHLLDRQEIDAMPEPVAHILRAESIVSMACIPMMGSANLLGIISLGSRQPDAFSQPDVELMAQVASQISLALENALAYGRLNVSRSRLEDERLYLESELQSQYNFEDIVGKSDALLKVLDQVAIVAPTDSTVLLIGETGTGKELIARAIHNRSTRSSRTFVRLNCAAIPQGLLESELFGHEKGAFTGAIAQKRGRLELAHEGSLFLDEIGDIGLDLQPKLLRVLQEREFERLGSNRTVKVDVRLIAATHRDLPVMVQDGEFREDLYYRLNVFPIYIPPLRERKDDIPLLVHYFVAQLAHKMHKSIRIIPRQVMEAMVNWPWPGNVRELQNFVERSIILSRGETLNAPISELNRELPAGESAADSFHAVERETILKALRAARGKISGPGGAAERLGLKRTTLQRKMERLDISRADFA